MHQEVSSGVLANGLLEIAEEEKENNSITEIRATLTSVIIILSKFATEARPLQMRQIGETKILFFIESGQDAGSMIYDFKENICSYISNVWEFVFEEELKLSGTRMAEVLINSQDYTDIMGLAT